MRWLLALILLAGLCPAVALAGDAPSRGPALDPAVGPVPWHMPVGLKMVPYHGPAGLLVLRQQPPAGPLDRGSAYTDAGVPGAPAPLTEAEKAKLELARAACAATRVGGFTAPPRETALTPLQRQRAAEQKLLRLRTAEPAKLAPFPAAGIGTDLPSVQKAGPEGLSPAERAKLEKSAAPDGKASTTPPAGTTGKEGR